MTDVERSATRHYEDPSHGPWLHAWFDPLAAVHTVTACVRLGDLFADGDSKMLICDLDKKLKVYKGTTMLHEYALLDSPVAACLFYTDTFVVRHTLLLNPCLYAHIILVMLSSAAPHAIHRSGGRVAPVHIPQYATLQEVDVSPDRADVHGNGDMEPIKVRRVAYSTLDTLFFCLIFFLCLTGAERWMQRRHILTSCRRGTLVYS